MKRSSDRILTTHVGSLVRPPEVLEDILLTVAGKSVDPAKFQEKVKAGVSAVVRKQAEIGIDIPSDGEFSKPTFTSYVSERLSGLGPTPETAKPYTYAKLTGGIPRLHEAVQRDVHDHVDAAVDPQRDHPGRHGRTARRPLGHRPDRLSGTGAGAARHQQLQVGAGRPVVRRGLHAVGDAVTRRCRQRQHLSRPKAPISTRSPTRCTRNTRRSSTPASSSSSISACPRATRSCRTTQPLAGRNCAARRRCRSRRTTTR